MKSSFQHHSKFPKPKTDNTYKIHNICLSCKTSFKLPRKTGPRPCPQCGEETFELSRTFSTPKKSDTKQWQKIEFLIQNGFYFQAVYDMPEPGTYYKASYPETLEEAKKFVIKYRNQALPCDYEVPKSP